MIKFRINNQKELFFQNFSLWNLVYRFVQFADIDRITLLYRFPQIMHSCGLQDLAKRLSPENNGSFQFPLNKEKISKLSELKHKSLYDKKPDQSVLKAQPWRNLPKYFTQALISALAFVKMSIHAKSGGSIEVMGMLTGKIVGNAIVVMDVYSLPVEGTETRVNAQNEAYEYMVQYLDVLKSVGREEHIVGWYHSHPGYGCWLSGIDVATQSLNQNFQDPYLAIVVDPVQTVNQGKVEIGAFRTLPIGYKAEKSVKVDIKSKSKMKDFGIHADQYYSLDIEVFKSKKDEEYIDMILNKSWVSNLLRSSNSTEEYDKRLGATVDSLLGKKQTSNSLEDPKAILRFNAMFEARLTKEASERWEKQPEYLAPDDDMMSLEGSVAPPLSDDDEEEEEEEEEEQDDSDTVEDESVKSKKRVLAEYKPKLVFHKNSPRRTKRLAKLETTLSNEINHKMQQVQSELKKEHRGVAAVGHSELVNLLALRTQRRVFQ